MLRITLRTGKDVLAFFTAKATFAADFRGMGFVSHVASSF